MGRLYVNGTIITMEEPLYAEALWEEDGTIRMVGSRAELERAAQGAQLVDLQGRVLLPGFLDPHSHITALASTMSLLDLSAATSFDDIAHALEAYKEKHALNPGEWVVGFGYDHNFLKERAHPARGLLDSVCPKNPVLLTHVSGHVGVLNSAALLAAGITADTPDPEGGSIGRENGEPNGYLEETAFHAAGAVVPPPPQESLEQGLARAQEVYLSFGITTAQDGLTRGAQWNLLQGAAEKDLFKLDVVCYPELEKNRELVNENPDYVRQYRNRLKIGGYKILLDGSPQGRTAWMLEPYENAEDGYRGYPTYENDRVESFVRAALEDRLQILAHCNGDAAARQFIHAYDRALFSTGLDGVRPVMIHAQLATPHQLERMAELSMIASFFTAHTYFWGDIHLQNFGAERASRISAAHTALEKGVVVTFHQDTPVIPPNMLQTLWCAVNRITKNGVVLGPQERISPLEALRAVTVNAAYQYFEEDSKGSLRPGKRADFVVLSDNPLTVDPMEIRNIQVLETIKDGVCVYRKGE